MGDRILDVRAVAAAPGTAWCSEWTAAVDAALRAWLDGADQPAGLAVVALGGYARAELCRGSDVDLLLLHDGWHDRDLAASVEALCYPLWDAGLSVGHAVRTAKEAVAAAGERIDTATALTDRRLVAGAGHLAEDLAARTTRWLRRDGVRMLAALAEADADRHATAGDRAGLLEPDLKNGAGGLRDVHSLRWAGALLLGEVGLDPLVAAGYLGADDRRDLAVAGQVVLSARCALHLVQGRRRGGAVPGSGSHGERLRLDLQDEVAARLRDPDGDVLLQRVGLAMRAVAHVHGRTWPRLLADARAGRRRRRPWPRRSAGITVADGVVEIVGGAAVADEPSLPLSALAVAATNGVHLGRHSAAWLRREIVAVAPLAWDEASRTALLDILRCGAAARPALADGDHLGLWTALLPEWPRVRGRPQRNPLHRFDLDTHGFEAVVELHGVVREQPEAWSRLTDPDAVLLATLLHDVGKAWAGDHSVTGGTVVRDWLDHMGVAEATAERVALLVRHHLLLPQVATRRDLEDHAELAAVADIVGDPELLDGLYLLSLADARATGPAAHSPWKDGLLATLHARVRTVLTGGRPLENASRRVAAARAEIGDAVDVLLAGAPATYVAAADAAQLLRHARLLTSEPAGGLRVRIDPGPAEGTVVLSLVAPDRPGLIAKCAGVLAGHGVPVLDARAFTRADRLALDWFTCKDVDVAWTTVLADVEGADRGELDVEALVEKRERRRDARLPALVEPVPVTVGVEERGDLHRIEVHGPDTPGVLWRVARALADAGYDVASARVATLGPEVRDAFLARPPAAGLDRAALVGALRAAAVPPAHLATRRG